MTPTLTEYNRFALDKNPNEPKPTHAPGQEKNQKPNPTWAVILLCCKPRAKSDFIQFYALFLGNPDPLAQSRLFRKGDDCPPSQKSRGISSVTFHRDAKQAYMVFRATSGLTQLIFYKRT